MSRRPRELSLPLVAVQWAQLLGIPVDSSLALRQKGVYLVLGMPQMTDRVCLLLHEFCKDIEHTRDFLPFLSNAPRDTCYYMVDGEVFLLARSTELLSVLDHLFPCNS